MQIMKRINEKEEEPLGAVADELNFTLKKGTKANKIRFVFTVLQDGATIPTLSDFLTQLATSIEIKIGNTTVIKISPTELAAYILRKTNEVGLSFVNDGTGADDQFLIFTLDLPLCPMDKDMIEFMNEEYGFDGSKDVNFKVIYPADANEIDTRLLDVYAVSIPNSTPSKVVEYEELTHTFAATGKDQALIMSQKTSKKIYEIFFKQTSYLSEGLTTRARTIERIAYQEANEDKEFFDIIVEHLAELGISSSGSTGVMLHLDQYFFLKFHHGLDAETSRQIASDSRLVVVVGVAEAITYTQIRIAPLSIYKT